MFRRYHYWRVRLFGLVAGIAYRGAIIGTEHGVQIMDIDDERDIAIATGHSEPDVVVVETNDKVNDMAEVIDLNGGGGLGAGLGGGLLGGILGGALLGNGLGRNNLAGDVGGVVTPALLASSLAQVTDTAMNTTVLQSLGDIKASVPLAEGQVQLALAGATGEIRSHLGAVENGILIGQTAINKGVSDAIAASLASQNNINVNVLQQGSATRESVAAYGVANLTATKDAQYATAAAISSSTKEILAALNDQNTANLQRQLTVAESALLENRLVGRARESEINITNTNTATAQQFQMQNQSQQQLQAIIQLNALVGNLANDIQVVRQGQTIFNSGTMAASGTQAAANTKVN